MFVHPHDLKTIVEAIEIPESYYDLARERYRSIGSHLLREGSTVRALGPEIHSQGSFRLGTAIRPLGDGEEYDVDLVCRLNLLAKTDMTQEKLRKTVHAELVQYVNQNSMKSPPRDRPRCITLDYAGQPSFHVDVLPCVPEDRVCLEELVTTWLVPEEWAILAIAITDRNDPGYGVLTPVWPSSNPGAYALWFVDRMNLTPAFREAKGLAEIPVYKRKLPLQRVVQLLKRHSCSFFAEAPDHKPISMIITTLAARLYQGERTVEEAFAAIVPRLAGAVSKLDPTVLNPVNPRENFADKWVDDPAYFEAYQDWCDQLARDLEALQSGNRIVREDVAEKAFRTSSGRGPRSRGPQIHLPRTQVSSPPGEKPWRMD